MGTIIILAAFAFLMFADIATSGLNQYRSYTETEVEVYAVPEANITEKVMVQYLDGDELKTLVFLPGDVEMHVHIWDENEPKLIRNETTRHWPGIISHDTAPAGVEWHIYLPRED